MAILCYVLILMVLFGQGYGYCDSIKNSSRKNSQVFLNVGDLDYAKEGNYKTVYCCAHNFHKIMWDFKNHGDVKWQQFPWDLDGLSLGEMNQTLSIEEVQKKHEGMYRCRAFNESGDMIASHNTEVKVYSCKDRVKPEAYGPQNQYANIGQTVTFTCSGDFGCTADGQQDVSWYDSDWNFLSDKDPRYKVSTMKRNKDTQIQSNFTVRYVVESDYGRNFTCYVSSTYSDGNRQFIVQLRKSSYVRRESVDSAGVISVGVLSAMVLLLGVILIIAMFYHQIKLFIYSRLPFGYLQDIGDKDYHVYILSEDQDISIAEKIKKQLEDDSYVVKTSGSILPNQDIMQMTQQNAERSKSLILIHPTDFKRNPNNNFERLCGVTEYFEGNLITIIKEKANLESVVDTLMDKTYVSFVFPSHEHGICVPFTERRFYSKLKLRLPDPRKKHKKGSKKMDHTKKVEDEDVTKLLHSQNSSPCNDGKFEYGGERNHVV